MNLFGDLRSARWIHMKGWSFLVIAVLAAAGLLLPNFSWSNLALLAIALWAASRWYYYMFYVIEKYVDPEFRFAGLGSAVRYLVRRKR